MWLNGGRLGSRSAISTAWTWPSGPATGCATRRSRPVPPGSSISARYRASSPANGTATPDSVRTANPAIPAVTDDSASSASAPDQTLPDSSLQYRQRARSAPISWITAVIAARAAASGSAPALLHAADQPVEHRDEGVVDLGGLAAAVGEQERHRRPALGHQPLSGARD